MAHISDGQPMDRFGSTILRITIAIAARIPTPAKKNPAMDATRHGITENPMILDQSRKSCPKV